MLYGATGAMRAELATVLFRRDADVRAAVDGSIQAGLGRRRCIDALADGAAMDAPAAMRYAFAEWE